MTYHNKYIKYYPYDFKEITDENDRELISLIMNNLEDDSFYEEYFYYYDTIRYKWVNIYTYEITIAPVGYGSYGNIYYLEIQIDNLIYIFNIEDKYDYWSIEWKSSLLWELLSLL